jgi:hypothetical protein
VCWLLLTVVGAVALLAARWREKGGVLGRWRWFGLLLLGVAVADVGLAVVPLLVRECVLPGWGPIHELLRGLTAVSSFPLGIGVTRLGAWTGTAVVFYVEVYWGGALLVPWVSPWLPMHTLGQVAWLAAAVLPPVVALDALTAVAAFGVVVPVDWVRRWVTRQMSKGAFSAGRLTSEAST